MAFQLVIVRGRSDLKAHHLGAGPSVAGRQEGCQLQIRSSQVSRRHCEFLEKAGQLTVKDLNSSNGTYVNGTRIEEPHVLKPGDEVTIGSVKFRVEKIGSPVARPADTAVPTKAVAPLDSDEAIVVEDDDKTVMAVPATKGAPESDHDVALSSDTPESSSDIELDEDDVADFLLDIDVDDDDKR